MIPYVKWYPGDWLASKAFRVLTFEQQGVYRALLDIAWQNCCRTDEPPTLPADPKELALELGTPLETFVPIWDAVARFWKTDAGGRLYNERQTEEYQAALEMIESRRKAGKEGGKGRPKKKQKTASAKQVLAHANKCQANVSYTENPPDSKKNPTDSRSKFKPTDDSEPTPEKITTPRKREANPAVVVGEDQAVGIVKSLLASDMGDDRPPSQPHPIGGMLGGRPREGGTPVSGESLANFVLAAWKEAFNGKSREPSIFDAEQIASALMLQGPRSNIHQAAARTIALLAEEAVEKRLDNPLAYLFGVLSKGGLPGWLAKETKAERKAREAAVLKAAVEEGRKMAKEGRR